MYRWIPGFTEVNEYWNKGLFLMFYEPQSLIMQIYKMALILDHLHVIIQLEFAESGS